MSLFEAVEVRQDLRKLERAARAVCDHCVTGSRDRVRGVAVHHVGTGEHAHGGKVLAIMLQRLFRVVLGALRVERIEGQLSEQRECVR